MVIKSNYLVKRHPKIDTQDLPELPEQIKIYFEDVYCYILSIDPYNRCALSGHYLDHGRLEGLYTIDLEDIDEYSYRVVYKISELNKKEVFIISIDRHDAAYKKAKERHIPAKPYRKNFSR